MPFYWIKRSVLPFIDRKFKELHTTGKWKLKYEPFVNLRGKAIQTLYIQHRGLFFNRWIDEHDIVEIFENLESINESPRYDL